jgi:sulfhydrogenase subunit beta (sulfur reductase)
MRSAPGSASVGQRILPASALDDLLAALRRGGYRVLGPTVRESAIVHREIGSAGDLARGWTDRQEAGSYRLERDSRDLYFGHNVGPQSWKRELYPPRLRLW